MHQFFLSFSLLQISSLTLPKYFFILNQDERLQRSMKLNFSFSTSGIIYVDVCPAQVVFH